MVTYPGDLTPAEQDEWAARMRKLALERWGEERADALSTMLRRVGTAIGRLERLQFSHSDSPGFYLHEMSGKTPEGRSS